MKAMRIFFGCGPGDVVGSLQDWSEGRDTSTETSVTFSSQIFDFCSQGGHSLNLVSNHPRRDSLVVGNLRAENRPHPDPNATGLAWHWNLRRHANSLLRTALDWRADVAVVDSGVTHWFMLSVFPRHGIPVIPSLHNSLWAKGYPPERLMHRAIRMLDGRFWRRSAAATICVSPECASQVREIAGRPRGPICDYRAKFRRAGFDALSKPNFSPSGTFRILYAGRVEESKGATDVIEMARLLNVRRPGRCEWSVCGAGSALNTVQSRVAETGLSNVRVHGRLARLELLRQYDWSHLVIVPTRSTFCEGLPLVAIEALLAGRPVLTSAVSNILDIFGSAAIHAVTNDINSYVRAIESMLDDPSLYAFHATIDPELTKSFLSPDGGLADALREVLGAVFADDNR